MKFVDNAFELLYTDEGQELLKKEAESLLKHLVKQYGFVYLFKLNNIDPRNIKPIDYITLKKIDFYLEVVPLLRNLKEEKVLHFLITNFDYNELRCELDTKTKFFAYYFVKQLKNLRWKDN
jgi:hypothetical protein